ncbi:hypothetical protein L2E82_14418 [Cichorium intybus]|uniref:Uncharacterized protein n=1 Tax=Cichorium intybus TaxID=13427 RepID=A0ACB9F134_CICIN|nr:hypothetical protein L2E82_14418 [Cichorium intybus]
MTASWSTNTPVRVRLKKSAVEERVQQKEIKKEHKEGMTKLKEEIRKNKVENREKKKESEKKKEENILKSSMKLHSRAGSLVFRYFRQPYSEGFMQAVASMASFS